LLQARQLNSIFLLEVIQTDKGGLFAVRKKKIKKKMDVIKFGFGAVETIAYPTLRRFILEIVVDQITKKKPRF